MKIGIDLDYTILSCNSFIYKVANKFQRLGNRKLSYTEIDNSNENITVSLLGKMISKFSKIFNPDEHIPYKDAIETINYLHGQGCEIHLISNRPVISSLISTTITWLNKYNLCYDKLIFNCSNKTAYAQQNGIDIMIDDKNKTCLNLANEGIESILLKNNTSKINNAKRKKNIPSNMLLQSSWSDIKEYFKSLIESNQKPEEVF